MRRRDFLAGSAALILTTAAPARADETAAAFHAARKFLDLPAGRIAYVEQGSGPAAIFLHGYPLNGFQWRGAMARLRDLRRCLAPDLMRLGYSEVPPTASLAPNARPGRRRTSGSSATSPTMAGLAPMTAWAMLTAAPTSG